MKKRIIKDFGPALLMVIIGFSCVVYLRSTIKDVKHQLDVAPKLGASPKLAAPKFKIGDCFTEKVSDREFQSKPPSYYNLVLKVGKESYPTELFSIWPDGMRSLGEKETRISQDDNNELVDNKFCKEIK